MILHYHASIFFHTIYLSYAQVCVVQSGPMQLSVDLIAHKLHHDLKTDIRIKGTYCTKVASCLFYKQVLVVMYAHRASL